MQMQTQAHNYTEIPFTHRHEQEGKSGAGEDRCANDPFEKPGSANHPVEMWQPSVSSSSLMGSVRNIPHDMENIPQKGPLRNHCNVEENCKETIFKLHFAKGRQANQ